MEDLLSKAEQLDNQKKLDEISRKNKLEKLHKWQRDSKKLYAWLIRTEENPPSDYDIQKLEMCMHFFRKTAGILLLILISSCSKESIEPTIKGSWINSETMKTKSNFENMIGETFKYPNHRKKFKLISTDGFIFHFECGHWCTDTVFEDLIRTKTGIQNYQNNQLTLF